MKMIKVSSGFVTGLIMTATGGALIVAGLVIKNANIRKYSPKPANENHIIRTEVGEEYTNTIGVDLKEKEAEFTRREFERYSK